MGETIRNMEPYALKRFVRKLFLVSRRHYDRENAHKQLDLHLKRLAKNTPKLQKDIGLLKRKIQSVLEHEKKLSVKEEADTKAIASLKNKLAELEMINSARSIKKEEIHLLRKSIADAREKLNALLQAKLERNERIKALEGKMRKASLKKTMLSSLKEKLAILEEKHSMLRSKYPADALQPLEMKIHDLKERIYSY